MPRSKVVTASQQDEFEAMPDRAPSDGPVSVRRRDDGTIIIAAESHGHDQGLACSEYNALRILAMLSVVLHAPLARTVARKIKL